MTDYLLRGLREHYAAHPAPNRVRFGSQRWSIAWVHDSRDREPKFGWRTLAAPRDFTGQPQGEAFGDLVAHLAYDAARHAELPPMGTMARNTLLRAGFWTAGQVAGASDRELLAIRNLGRGSLAQIRAACGGPPPPAAQHRCPHCGGALSG